MLKTEDNTRSYIVYIQWPLLDHMELIAGIRNTYLGIYDNVHTAPEDFKKKT